MSEVEQIKRESRHLRGTIAERVAQTDIPFFEERDAQLLKFHGVYQQDDRDVRDQRRRAGQDKAWIMMIRSSIPGGQLTAEQYLVHDRAADELAGGTLRITSRQGLQMHHVIKGNLKTWLQRVNASGITTWGACGDVVRNVVATPVPFATPVYQDVRQLAIELAQTFRAKSRAYSEIWLDGERVLPETEVEPIYGEAYMPRKFKIGIAVPPRNDVDIYTHDVGLVAHAPNGQVEGYTVLVGGGCGMTHGKVETYPVMARPLGYVPRDQVIHAVTAVVTTQRDYGDRENRRHARLKYLVEDRGIDWVRTEVCARMPAPEALRPALPLSWETVGDLLGWHEQGDGNLFCGVFVQDGRIKDTDHARTRTGFREICSRFGFPIRLTPNCNILFCAIPPTRRAEVDRILADHGIPHTDGFTEARKTCMACVSLPTCGLGLAESERVFDGVMNSIDTILHELDLANEPLLVRMTGCPNGCARPYNADFGFVGRSPGKYAFFVGGAHNGTRLAGLQHKVVSLEEIPTLVRRYLEQFVAERLPGETFSDYWGRTHDNGPAPHPEQFHKELAGRASGHAAD